MASPILKAAVPMNLAPCQITWMNVLSVVYLKVQ
jgi:hypothetical protein